MDEPTLLGITTVVISLASLAVAIAVAVRQHRRTTDSLVLPVVLQAFRETHSAEFFEAQEYVVNKLSSEHDPSMGYRGLPEDARHKLRTVGQFYDDLGKLVAYGVIPAEFVIGTYGSAVRWVWNAVEPFVYRERKLRGSNFWICLEDLAARAVRMPPATIHAKLGLRQYRATTARTPLEE